VKVASLLKQAGFGLRYRLRMSRGRRAVMAHLASPTTAPVPWPTFVQLRVTNVCNLRCKMCGQWGETGIFREGANASATDGEAERQHIHDLIGQRHQLSVADYVRLLDELAPHKPVISLFGGEPLLYPEIIQLVREIKRRGFTLSAITNGWLLERYARELVELGIDAIAVSVDGPHGLHDEIRGRSTSFERLAAGVKAVARFRTELSRPFPVLMAILPITELNIEQVGAATEELSDLPLDLINVGLRWFVPPDAGARYEAVMQETFGVSGGSWKGFDFSWPGGAKAAHSEQMLGLVKQLGKLRKGRVADLLAGRPWISFLPEIAATEVPSYFTDFRQTFGHDLCPVAWYFAQVEPDGEVCFCGDFPDYFLGNVKKLSFREIWTGPRATAFREKLAREPLPVCARCCGSYLYGKWQRPNLAAREDAPARPGTSS
jgi:MoaA/NifB/PqqE/SkfB family radical SAM enzyme